MGSQARCALPGRPLPQAGASAAYAPRFVEISWQVTGRSLLKVPGLIYFEL
jgi:hypothetical protein